MNTRSSHNWGIKKGLKDKLNLSLIDFETDFPIINCDNIRFSDTTPCNNYSSITTNSLVTCFNDDYILERFWNNPLKYGEIYKKAAGVITPDFSILLGMPMPVISWQVYRNRLIGHVWQSMGCNVIPSISWGCEKTYNIAFSGVKKNSIVAISNIGCRNEKNFEYFINGFNEMIKIINPTIIIFMCNKKYKPLFTSQRIIFIDSFWDKKRKQWAEEAGKI